MLEKAHQETGRHYTVVIMYSLEAQEIDMKGLREASREEVLI